MERKQVKTFLKECYSFMQKSKGIHPIKDGVELINDDSLFEAYVEALSEGLRSDDKEIFKVLAENTRRVIAESITTAAINTPYNFLLLPLLRIFFPRLVAREAVTVTPIDRPFAIKYFLKAIARTLDNRTVELPDYSGTLSAGTPYALSADVNLSGGAGRVNILQANGITTPQASLQRVFSVVQLSDGTDTVQVYQPVDNTTGTAVVNVTYPTSGVRETVRVNVNFTTGDVTVAVESTTNSGGPTTQVVSVQGMISLELNDRTTEIELKLEPYQLSAISRKLNVKWTIEFEQDVKALLDVDSQSEMLSILAAQIATDIDKEILQDLLNAVLILNNSNIRSWNETPPASFTFGPKIWYETIVVELNKISAKVYQDTAIAPANIIICNPLDLAILQSTGEYSKTGDLTGGDYIGTTPYAVGELSNKWRVLATQLMPEKHMLVVLKPEDERASVYLYAPYRPVTIYPWPMANVPSLTYMSRYAKQLLRPKGIGLLRIV